MDAVFKRLNERAAAKGSMVVTNDGMVVAGIMRQDMRKDIVGALSSFLISATGRCLRQGGIGSFGRMIMTATHGKVVIKSLEDYFLVVIVDQFADMDAALQAVEVAGKEFKKIARIEVG
jgi:predicted regulator of Ras-like GTPase activity (Roadblock/LC7/MglB family)